MSETIEIKKEDLIRVFRAIENVHDLIHQPMKYKDVKVVSDFADAHYAEIRDLYYDTLWNYLPAETKQKIENE